MKSYNHIQLQLPDEKRLFSEEEINNISALIVVLKQIRMRLRLDCIDIDSFKKLSGTITAFDK